MAAIIRRGWIFLLGSLWKTWTCKRRLSSVFSFLLLPSFHLLFFFFSLILPTDFPCDHKLISSQNHQKISPTLNPIYYMFLFRSEVLLFGNDTWKKMRITWKGFLCKIIIILLSSPFLIQKSNHAPCAQSSPNSNRLCCQFLELKKKRQILDTSLVQELRPLR